MRYNTQFSHFIISGVSTLSNGITQSTYLVRDRIKKQKKKKNKEDISTNLRIYTRTIHQHTFLYIIIYYYEVYFRVRFFLLLCVFAKKRGRQSMRLNLAIVTHYFQRQRIAKLPRAYNH